MGKLGNDRPFDAVRGKGAKHRGDLLPDRMRIRIEANIPCRTLADMSEDEIQALERQYGCPVIRPAKAR